MYMINSLGQLYTVVNIDNYKPVNTISMRFKKIIAVNNKKYMLLDVEGNIYTITTSNYNLKIVSITNIPIVDFQVLEDNKIWYIDNNNMCGTYHYDTKTIEVHKQVSSFFRIVCSIKKSTLCAYILVVIDNKLYTIDSSFEFTELCDIIRSVKFNEIFITDDHCNNDLYLLKKYGLTIDAIIVAWGQHRVEKYIRDNDYKYVVDCDTDIFSTINLVKYIMDNDHFGTFVSDSGNKYTINYKEKKISEFCELPGLFCELPTKTFNKKANINSS